MLEDIVDILTKGKILRTRPKINSFFLLSFISQFFLLIFVKPNQFLDIFWLMGIHLHMKIEVFRRFYNCPIAITKFPNLYYWALRCFVSLIAKVSNPLSNLLDAFSYGVYICLDCFPLLNKCLLLAAVPLVCQKIFLHFHLYYLNMRSRRDPDGDLDTSFSVVLNFLEPYLSI